MSWPVAQMTLLGALAAGAGADHVAHVGHQVALLLQVLDELHRAPLAVFLGLERRVGARVLEHRQVVQRDVRAAPGVGRGAEVVGVGLAGHLEDGDGDRLRHFGPAGEPLGVGPAAHHVLGHGVAGLRLLRDIVEEVEHQQCLLEPCCGHRRQRGVVQQLDQRVHVVAADHGAQQFGGLRLAEHADRDVAVRDRGQEAGLDLRRVVHARRHAVRQQVEQEGFFARRRRLDEFDQRGDLLGAERQRRDAERGAFGDMLTVGLQHGVAPGKRG
jgi:hypothetical protein